MSKRFMLTVFILDTSDNEDLEPYETTEIEHHINQLPFVKVVDIMLDDITGQDRWNKTFEEK